MGLLLRSVGILVRNLFSFPCIDHHGLSLKKNKVNGLFFLIYMPYLDCKVDTADAIWWG